MQTKICSKCKKDFPISEFYKQEGSKYGVSCWCKRCKKDYARRYQEAHPEQHEAAQRKYRERYPERAQKRQYEYRERIGDEEFKRRARKGTRKSYRKHQKRRQREARESYDPEKRHERYMRNRDTVLARQRKYTQRPEIKIKRREQQRKWTARNREAAREYCRRRSAKKQNAEGSHTIKEWLALCKKCGWQCVACGSPHTNDNPLTMDHIVPLSKNGRDSIDNIQPLCRKCNSAKGTKSTNYRRK